MLAFLRRSAKLEPKAEGYGGWDGDGRQLTGHIAGHDLSGVSLAWAATGDPRFKERAGYIVNELKLIQDAQGDGYLGALMGRNRRRQSRQETPSRKIRVWRLHRQRTKFPRPSGWSHWTRSAVL